VTTPLQLYDDSFTLLSLREIAPAVVDHATRIA